MQRLVVCCLLLCAYAHATSYPISPGSSFISQLQSMRPGDEMVFQAGTHSVNGKIGFTLNGTPQNPIVVRGVGGAIIRKTDTVQNIMDFQGSNFIIKDLELVGGSRGLRVGENGNVANALFQNLKIHGTQDTAFNFNQGSRDYNNITIRNVEIWDTGSGTSECFYLGCNENDCVFRNSLVEYCYCHDTLAADTDYGSGLQVKSGSYNNIIRHNVFRNVKSNGVHVYDSYDLGINQVIGNLVVNPGANGIQVTAGALISSNVVFNAGVSGVGGLINQLKAGTQPRDITITHNTIVGAGDACVRGNNWGTNAASIRVANNACFTSKAWSIGNNVAAATFANNGVLSGNGAPSGQASSTVFTIGSAATELTSTTNFNAYPKSTSTLLNAGSNSFSSGLDFNCLSRRSPPTVGAYQYTTSTNPGWAPFSTTFKTCSSSGSSTTGVLPSTTARATTGVATTARATTGVATTARATTGVATTARATTGVATTARATTGVGTTARATTAPATTGVATTGAIGRVFTIAPGDAFITTLQNLRPGDEVVFQTGTHTVTSKAAFTATGTATAPIVIRGEPGAIIQRPNANQNIMDFQGSYFILKDLEFIGGSRGLRLGETGNLNHVTFQNLKIHGTQTTAMTFNQDTRDYNNIIIRNVEVWDTGADTSECFYLGCNDNACVFRNSLVESCYCHDTMAASVDYGSGLQVKGGSYNNIIRDNIFENIRTNGIHVYDSYDLGPNQVIGNFIKNTGDNGIQVTAGAIISNNIVINAGTNGIGGLVNQLKQGTSPRSITITHNTIVNAIGDACLRGNAWGTNDNTILVANNAFFCQKAFSIGDNIGDAFFQKNAVLSGNNAPSGVAASGVFVVGDANTELASVANNNLYPKSTSALIGAGVDTRTSATDFNCLPRSSPHTVGAYHYSSSTNPGWVVFSTTFKPQCTTSGESITTADSEVSASITVMLPVWLLLAVSAVLCM